MSDGFIYWYLNDWSPDAAGGLLVSLRDARITLINPETGSASWITNGPESYGEQVFVTGDELAAEVGRLEEGDINFQLWLDAETDVFTRVRMRSSGDAVVELALDGLTLAEETHVISVVIELVEWRPGGTAGLVVDRLGDTAEVDWDAAVGGMPVSIPSWPDALGLPVGHQVTCSEPVPAPSRRLGDLSMVEKPDLRR